MIPIFLTASLSASLFLTFGLPYSVYSFHYPEIETDSATKPFKSWKMVRCFAALKLKPSRHVVSKKQSSIWSHLTAFSHNYLSVYPPSPCVFLYIVASTVAAWRGRGLHQLPSARVQASVICSYITEVISLKIYGVNLLPWTSANSREAALP